jgi:hypothetical protein
MNTSNERKRSFSEIDTVDYNNKNNNNNNNNETDDDREEKVVNLQQTKRPKTNVSSNSQSESMFFQHLRDGGAVKSVRSFTTSSMVSQLDLFFPCSQTLNLGQMLLFNDISSSQTTAEKQDYYKPLAGQLPYAHKRRTSIFLLSKQNLILKRHRYETSTTSPRAVFPCVSKSSGICLKNNEHHLADFLFSLLLSRLRALHISPYFCLLVDAFYRSGGHVKQSDSIELIYENVLPESIQPDNISFYQQQPQFLVNQGNNDNANNNTDNNTDNKQTLTTTTNNIKTLSKFPNTNYTLLCFAHHFELLCNHMLVLPPLSPLWSNERIDFAVDCIDQLTIQGLAGLASMYESYHMILYDVHQRNIMFQYHLSDISCHSFTTPNHNSRFNHQVFDWGGTTQICIPEPFLHVKFIDPEYAVCNPLHTRPLIPKITQSWVMQHDSRICGTGDAANGFLPGYDVQTFFASLLVTLLSLFPIDSSMVKESEEYENVKRARRCVVNRSIVGSFILQHPEWFPLYSTTTTTTTTTTITAASNKRECEQTQVQNSEKIARLERLIFADTVSNWGYPRLEEIMTSSALAILQQDPNLDRFRIPRSYVQDDENDVIADSNNNGVKTTLTTTTTVAHRERDVPPHFSHKCNSDSDCDSGSDIIERRPTIFFVGDSSAQCPVYL